ncbi:porin family protein [Capnocytophaga canimorsus]|uniref:porin family protein n=1 Tax=Capnocytophaga canimorsus TaxID=28188 RepID=UPI00385B50B9
MKKIFKIALVALFGVVGYTANAQETGLSLKAGVNFNGASGDDAKGSKGVVGFHAGLGYEAGFTDIFAFETGAYFDMRGYKVKDTGVISEEKVSIYSVTVPVLAKARFEVLPDVRAFVNAGPFANIGIMGKAKLGDKGEDVKFGNKEDEIERFGYGVNFGAGVDFNKFVVGVGYDLGLNKLAENNKTYTNAFKVNVGFKF